MMDGFMFLVVMQVCDPAPSGIGDDMLWQSRCHFEMQEISTKSQLESLLLSKERGGMGWIKVYRAKEVYYEIEEKTKDVERTVKESVVIDRKVKFK